MPPTISTYDKPASALCPTCAPVVHTQIFKDLNPNFPVANKVMTDAAGTQGVTRIGTSQTYR